MTACLLFLCVAAMAAASITPETAHVQPGLLVRSPGCSVLQAGVCQEEGIEGSPRVARDHQLLQINRQLSVDRASGASKAPGDFGDGHCRGMQGVERVCSESGCKVLATEMRGKTCTDFCAMNGRTCVGAWEEVQETCQVLADLRCDQTWGDTSDLICECSANSVREQDPTGIQCAGMHNVERSCSANGCKVLANKMGGRTCREYCGDSGLSCVGAWEEVNEDCNVKAEMTCDQTWPHTSDLLCECMPLGGSVAPPPDLADPSRARLVWSDDFDGGRLDSSKWSLVRGGGGFGNQELQFYTDRSSNVRVEQGVLKITAKCEEYAGHHFTSAKLQSTHKGVFGPGHRVEVRARLPGGKGTWPAIWMLPTDSVYGRWPKSGEIDIMEAVGCTENKVYGTVHTEAYNHMHNTEKYNSIRTDVGAWHTYSIEWTTSQILWFVDGRLYHSFAPSSRSSDKWPFDRQFFLILNLAVGGSWGGKCVNGRPSCSSNSEFGLSQVMEVDYARVYGL